MVLLISLNHFFSDMEHFMSSHQCSLGIGFDKKKIEHKIVYIFLPISSNIYFGCSKELSH